MELTVDLRQPVPEPVRSVLPTDLWIIPLAAVDAPLARPAPRQNSYLSECECPDDCLRDHENE